jgi:hypothetical protein
MRRRWARQLESREWDIRIKEMHAHMRGTELEQEEKLYVVLSAHWVYHWACVVTHVLYDQFILYGVPNFSVYGVYICVWLNVWTMCWIICDGVILITYVFLCMFLSYMLCFNACIMCTNQWEQYVWFFVDFTKFLSMLPILHGQSVYNMYKPVKTICMIFIYASNSTWPKCV